MNNLSKSIVEDRVVFFVHIPKTAGTTLRHIIQYQFQPNNVFEFYRLGKKPHQGIDEFNNLSKVRKDSIKFVSGHIGFGLHEFLPRPYSYITVLRNPIDRVVSHYYFLQTRNKSIRNQTLEEFVQTYRRAQNSMTNFLSGVELKAQLADQSSHSDYERFSSETLELAKKNLKEYFKVVGILERFDETCLLLKKSLGWDIPLFYLKKNVSKNRPKTRNLPKDTLNLIEKFNELDIQLYEYAKEMFEETIKQQGSAFEKEFKELQLANEASKTKLYFFKLHSFYKRLLYKSYEVLNNFSA